MVQFPDASKVPPEPGHRSVPSATSAPAAAPTPLSSAPPAGAPLAPTGAPPSTTAAALAAAKPDKGHPPRVASESDQLKALDVVDAALERSAPDTPEGQQMKFRLRALYRMMVTGTGKSESWGNALNPIAAARLILFCQANGLDPSGNDVYILGDRPYLAFAGRLKLAHRSGTFEGYEVDRPMTGEERTMYAIPQDARAAWIAFARRRDCRFGFLGTGYVSAEDRNPVAKQFPLDMAQKRARANALELAYPADVSTSPIEEGMRRVEIETVESRPASEPTALPNLPGSGPTGEAAAATPPAEGNPPAAESSATS